MAHVCNKTEADNCHKLITSRHPADHTHTHTHTDRDTPHDSSKTRSIDCMYEQTRHTKAIKQEALAIKAIPWVAHANRQTDTPHDSDETRASAVTVRDVWQQCSAGPLPVPPIADQRTVVWWKSYENWEHDSHSVFSACSPGVY